MATKRTQSKKEKAFTIVELLTVMSVIIILIGLLVPALNKVRQYAKEVRQNAQFHSIDIALEMFDKENEGFPDSDPTDTAGDNYCGAMKLAEALVGQDLLGFHRDSMFMADMEDTFDNVLYDIPEGTDPDDKELKARLGPYLQLDNANATRITPYVDTGNQIDDPGIWADPGSDFRQVEYAFVLCDVFTRRMGTGYKTGMPILYYRANDNGRVNPNPRDISITYDDPDDDRFYKHEDNQDLVDLVNPWNGQDNSHPMDATGYSQTDVTPWPGLPYSFYYQINNNSIPVDDGRPYRSDSYILLSAGADGLYGTRDDIYNFQKK